MLVLKTNVKILQYKHKTYQNIKGFVGSLTIALLQNTVTCLSLKEFLKLLDI